MFNSYMSSRNSFYWNKTTMSAMGASIDYKKAHIRHWQHASRDQAVLANTLEAEKPPLESYIWYFYNGQSSTGFQSPKSNNPNAIARKLPDGSSQIHRISYNAQGRVTGQVDPAGRQTSFDYAANGIDRIAARQSAGSRQETIASWTYDAHHLPLTITDAAGQTTTYEWDANRRLVSQTDPGGITVRYDYDPDGRLIAVTDGKGQTTRWERDIQGRITKKIYPNGDTQLTTWDSARRMSSQSDPLGHVRTLAWSIDDQPLGWQYSGGPYANAGMVNAQYDSLYPRLISSHNQVSTTTYQYHPAGILGAGQVASRNVQYNLSNGISTQHQIAYAYDALGRVTTRTLDGQFVSSYEYDQIGRLHSEQNPLGKFVMSYLGQTSQPTGQALQGRPWRVNYAWEDNTRDRALSQIGFAAPQCQSESLEAMPPLGSAVVSQEPFAPMWRATPVSWDGRLNFSFNALGQLVSSQQGSDHHHYSYDPSGRLVQDLRTLNIQSLGSYGYDEADNLTLLDDDSGFSHFTHDSGNAVVEQSGDMVQRWVVDAAGQTREDAWNYYGWDSAGRLLGVKNKYSGVRTDFERDAQGRLIGSVSATERHAYLWCDEYTPCARVNAHGQIDALYYGQGEVSAAAPYHRYYARDHLGSVRAMVDAQGEVIGRQDYSAYGSVVAQSGLMPSVGYAGMWQHHESGIILALLVVFPWGRWLRWEMPCMAFQTAWIIRIRCFRISSERTCLECR